MLKFLRYFGNGAVVQRGETIKVDGYCSGEVTCTLKGGRYSQEKSCVAADGKFSVCFPPVTDTKSEFVLSARSGKEEISVKLRFGDVYLMMGQSNMSYVLSATEEYEKWLERAQACDVSVISLEEPPVSSLEELTRPVYPQEDFIREYDWRGGAALSDVSAISVQTAVLLYEKTGVPVGIVNASMGGLCIESYLPREEFEKDEILMEFGKRVDRYQTVEEFNHAGSRNYTQISGVWNEKIAPLFGRKFKGFVWYLGESSALNYEMAVMFEREMQLLIKSLRGRFGNLPFVAVQIAPEYYPYGDRYGYEYINEAIDRFAEITDGVCALPVYDIEPRWLKTDGDIYFHPIHPVNKAPISERIAAALSGGRFLYPRIEKVEYEEGRAVVTVKNVGKGLAGDEYRGFTLADEKGKYYPARAHKTGKNTVEVTSVDVAKPTALTYAFMQYQDFCNVKTADGSPLLPFRSNAEDVNGSYYFPPAFTVDGALTVYESNFGCTAGTTHKVPVWKSGTIYACDPVKITGEDGAVKVTANPVNEDYFLFGISPVLCLCGHKSHFSDFAYLNFDMKGDEGAEFLGIIVRRADGEIFRLNLMNGEKQVQSLPLSDVYRTYCVCLEQGQGGDGGPITFAKEVRKFFIEAEFSFRSKKPATLFIKGVTLSDKNLSEEVRFDRKTEMTRADIQLPDTDQ